MPKRKTKTSTEHKKNKKERSGSPPSNDALAKALAHIQALESRCDQLAAEKQNQNEQLQTQNGQLQTQNEQLQTLQTQNEQLQTQFIKLEQHLTAHIKDLTLEVDELKTELGFFRSFNISLCC